MPWTADTAVVIPGGCRRRECRRCRSRALDGEIDALGP